VRTSVSIPTRLSILLFATLVCAVAQDTRGSILGRVLDPSGAVIPGVTVRATNVNTNVTSTTRSNDVGNYEIPFLLPGTYRMAAESQGFKTFVRDGIELRIGDRIALDAKMEIGAAGEVVTVSGETPLLETATASVGQVIDQRRFADMPIAHGNPYLLMSLSAGVVYTANPGLDRPFEPGHIIGYSMGGIRAMRSEITLDGSPNTLLSKGSTSLSAGYTPPADIVQEFKVETASFDASVGHTQGGVTNITLKSGGNQIHGTGYYSLLNPALNANLFFANKAGQPKGDFTYKRWGGTATGPVFLPKLYNGKDRTFFTYGYEGIHEGRAMGAAYGEGTLTVPTAAQQKGDFSQLLALGSNYQIYDPATRKPAANGRYQIAPLPGNIIPASRINPIAAKLLTYWSLPNAEGTRDGMNNLIRVNDPEQTTYLNHVGRLDHSFSDRHRMFVRASTYRRFSFLRDWFRSDATGMNSKWFPKSAAIDDVYHLSATTFLNLRYSIYRLQITQYPKDSSLGFDLESLGFPASYTSQIPKNIRRFPAISITNYSSTQDNWYNYLHTSHALEGSITSLKGAHTLKIGADARNYRSNNYQWDNGSTGAFSFGTTWTRGPYDNSPVSPMGQGLASMLLGLPTGGRVDRNASNAQQSTVWSMYIQDNYRVTPRLTLSLGLRYEVEGPLTERWNRSVQRFDFSTASPIEAQARANYAASPIPELPVSQFRVTGGLLFAGVGGQPRTLWNRDWNNIMPRAGLAFKINEKTVLRAGFGAFYGPLGIHRVNVNQTGFSLSTQLVPSIDDGLTFDATLSNPFPTGILQPRGAADGLMTYAGRSVSFFDQNPQAPAQQRWQLSVQRELPQRVLVEVGYVGNRGSSLEATRDLRPLPLEYLSHSPVRDDATNNYLSAAVPNPFYGLLPGSNLAGKTVNRSYLLTSGNYDQFTGLTSTSYGGYSWYHSLQARVERRFAKGFTLNATYLWSKNMEATGRLNGEYSPLEYVVSDQDRPHRIVVSGIWELPFGKGRPFLASSSGLVDRIVGGWQAQGIYTGQSGQALGFGNALFIGDIHNITLPSGQRTPDRWFNIDAGFERASAKQLVSNYRLMPTRFNDVRGAGMNQWDLSVIKNTRVNERFTAQFRGEFLNAFNHPNFGLPNTTPTSSAFGQVTSQQGYPRRIQLGLKLLF